MKTIKRKVKNLRRGDVVVNLDNPHAKPRTCITDAMACRARGYFRVETDDPNNPVNTFGDNEVDVRDPSFISDEEHIRNNTSGNTPMSKERKQHINTALHQLGAEFKAMGAKVKVRPLK